MPVGFGFSVGDFIACIDLLTTGYYAARSAGGARDQYQRDIEWLEQLVTILQKLKEDGGDDVPQLSESCKKPLDEFKAKIKAKYDRYLGVASKCSRITVAANSIRWTFAKDASKDLVKLKEAIGPQLTLIELNMSLEQERSYQRVETMLDSLAMETKVASEYTSTRLKDMHSSVEDVKSNSVALSTPSAAVQSSTIQITTQLNRIGTTLESTKLSYETQEQNIKHLHLDSSARSDELSCQLKELNAAMDTRLATIQSDLQSMRLESLASRNALQEATRTMSARDRYLEAALKPWIRNCVEEATMAVISRNPAAQSGKALDVATYTQAIRPTHASQKTIAGDESPQRPPKDLWSTSWFVGFGTLTITVKQNTRVDSQSVKYDLELRPIAWLGATTRALTVFRYINIYGTSRIEWQPRAYSILPSDAPIIQACQKLDIDLIKDLFKSGAASPFDVTLEGFTLISYIADTGLVGISAPYIDDDDGDMFKYNMFSVEKLSSFLDILELLVNCGVDCGDSSIPVQGCTALEYIMQKLTCRPKHYQQVGQIEGMLLRCCRILCEKSRTQPFEKIPAFQVLCSSHYSSVSSYVVYAQTEWPVEIARVDVQDVFDLNEWLPSTVTEDSQALTSVLSQLNERFENGQLFGDRSRLTFTLEDPLYPHRRSENHPLRPRLSEAVALHDEFFRLWFDIVNPSTEQLQRLWHYADWRDCLPDWERVLSQNGYYLDKKTQCWEKTRPQHGKGFDVASVVAIPGSFSRDDETFGYTPLTLFQD